MGSELIIVPALFSVIFGIVYLVVTARHKERMALIEKGTDASIFHVSKPGKSNVLPIIILNLALLLMSVGVAIFIGALLNKNFGVISGVAYTGSIFLISGVGMYIGFQKSIAILNRD